jgi:hypothetical protein
MLEEVGEPGFSWFDFIPGARTDDGVKGDDIRIIKGDRDDFQAVFQFLDLIIIRKDLGAFEKRWSR